MCPAIHINSRSWLRSSSTHEPSDPPLRVVYRFRVDGRRTLEEHPGDDTSFRRVKQYEKENVTRATEIEFFKPRTE